MADAVASKTRVFPISLGCAKNLVDTEYMLGLLGEQGFVCVSEAEEADCLLINTCGFIREAEEEALETIEEALVQKCRDHRVRVVVAGCLVQRRGYRLARAFPEVDGWLGTGQLHRIVEIVKGPRKEAAAPFLIGRAGFSFPARCPRVKSHPFFSSYLKIAEGCSHRCTFCTIPRIRGPYRSRDPRELVQEAKELAAQGVRELNLVAQDTTRYGADLEEGACLEGLLEALLRIEGLEWIRVLYAHPSGVSDRLLDLLQGEERLCPYLDVPLQHISDLVLGLMGRGYTRKDVEGLLERIHRGGRDITVRSTLMVGFPGETEEHYRELEKWISEGWLHRLGVFVFSPEQGTRAARLGPPVDPAEAEARQQALMEIQAQISQGRHEALCGRVVPVLVEGYSQETELLLTGRTSGMAPEVDGRVIINQGEAEVGGFTPVRIREAYAYDLVGEVAEGLFWGLTKEPRLCG